MKTCLEYFGAGFVLLVLVVSICGEVSARKRRRERDAWARNYEAWRRPGAQKTDEDDWNV